MNVRGDIDFSLAAQCSPKGWTSSIIVRAPLRDWRAIRLAIRARSSICSGVNWKLSLTLSPAAEGAEPLVLYVPADVPILLNGTAAALAEIEAADHV